MRGGNTDPIRARRCVYKKNITKWIKIGRTQKHRSCTSKEMRARPTRSGIWSRCRQFLRSSQGDHLGNHHNQHHQLDHHHEHHHDGHPNHRHCWHHLHQHDPPDACHHHQDHHRHHHNDQNFIYSQELLMVTISHRHHHKHPDHQDRDKTHHNHECGKYPGTARCHGTKSLRLSTRYISSTPTKFMTEAHILLITTVL